MNKKYNLIILTVILLTLIMSFVPIQKTSALSLNDLDVKYVDGNIQHGKDSVFDETNNSQKSFWTRIFSEYKGIIIGVSGIGTLTFILFFVMNFIKLGKSADSPNDRSKALSGLLWTGIATAGFGGVTIFVGLFANLIVKK